MRNQVIFDKMCSGKIELPKEFVSLYPTMSQLLQQATIIDSILNGNQRFRQYIWLKGESCFGWLCQLEHCTPQGRNIIPEHILLAHQLGGIIQYWSNDKHETSTDTLIDANKFTFPLTLSFKGMGGVEDHYLKTCENNNTTPLDSNDFVTFALEANGNTTFYQKDTKEVFYYSFDGYSPIGVNLVEGQPEYTIHKLAEVNTFIDYVETLAKQWLTIINE